MGADQGALDRCLSFERRIQVSAGGVNAGATPQRMVTTESGLSPAQSLAGEKEAASFRISGMSDCSPYRASTEKASPSNRPPQPTAASRSEAGGPACVAQLREPRAPPFPLGGGRRAPAADWPRRRKPAPGTTATPRSESTTVVSGHQQNVMQRLHCQLGPASAQSFFAFHALKPAWACTMDDPGRRRRLGSCLQEKGARLSKPERQQGSHSLAASHRSRQNGRHRE